MKKLRSENASLPYFKEYHAVASPATGAFAVQLDGAYCADALGRRGPHYGPYALRVAAASGARRALSRVTFGDVLVCAGDDAMGARVGALRGARAVAREAAANFTNVRLWSDDGRGWRAAPESSAYDVCTNPGGVAYRRWPPRAAGCADDGPLKPRFVAQPWLDDTWYWLSSRYSKLGADSTMSSVGSCEGHGGSTVSSCAR